MVDLNIINGRAYLSNGLFEVGLSIESGKIVAIGKNDSLPKAGETINASNKIILPGAIDAHTHILDLIFDYREDFLSGTQAAASGGITTILEMPLGIEGVSVLDVFDKQLEVMNRRCLVDFGVIGAAGYSSIETIKDFAEKGAIAFKTFMINPSEEEAELKDLAAKDDYFLIKIFSEIAKTGLVSCVHAENDAIIANKIAHLLSIGRKDFQAHTESRPAISEDEACSRAMLLAHYTKTKLHLVHMSSKKSFEMIKDAKLNGWDVTCEITPHHLFLTSEDGMRIGPWAKVDPPLRSKEHMLAAWNALNDGTIDMVASDHSPYNDEEKTPKNNNFFEVGSGTTGIETSLPMMLNACNNNRISLNRLVEVMSTNPAKRFRLYPRKGVITINADADLIIVNMRSKYVLKNADIFTKPKITIFDGMNLQGKIETTLVRGQIVYENGEFPVENGFGQFINPQYSNPP
ncbi:MAG: dihydroorotase family protein [Candidatus Hodarchaeota archaeon]